MFGSISTLWCFPLALLTLLWVLNRILVPKPLPGIPYNRWTRWLPFGDLVTLGVHFLTKGSVFDWVSNQCLNHKSPVVQIMVPSFSMTTPVLLVADLHEVKDLIVKRVNDIDRATMMRYGFDVLVPNATLGMHTTATFKRQRHLWSCMLSPQFLDNVAAPAFGESTRRSIELWKLKAQMSNGSSFAAYEDLRRVTLEGIWRVLSGRDLGLADASISYLQLKKRINSTAVPSKTFPVFSQDLEVMMTGLVWVVTGISPRLYKWLFNSIPRFRIAANRSKDMVAGLISETRIHMITGLPTARCALSEVLRQQDNSVPDAAVIDEMLELLIVGHETTASTTGWGLKYLADHQEVQNRLFDELKRAFPGTSSSYLPGELEIYHAKIPYLDAVIAEILRLCCTGPILFRETIRDCEIMGYQVPANTPVLMITQSPAWSMITPDTFAEEERIGSSRLEKLPLPNKAPKSCNWSSSFEEFIPDRWLDGDGNFDADAGLSLPFSAGKRGCFGKRIAMLELKLLISMLVLSFHFPQLGKSQSKYNSIDNLTRQPACCYVRPVPRQG